MAVTKLASIRPRFQPAEPAQSGNSLTRPRVARGFKVSSPSVNSQIAHHGHQGKRLSAIPMTRRTTMILNGEPIWVQVQIGARVMKRQSRKSHAARAGRASVSWAYGWDAEANAGQQGYIHCAEPIFWNRAALLIRRWRIRIQNPGCQKLACRAEQPVADQ